MAKFPHRVSILIHKEEFRNLLTWLDSNNHVLHETMKFGRSHHISGEDKITQSVMFLDKDAAMLFKLSWCGR